MNKDTDTVILNITNHPMARWNADQAGAALELADYVMDIPFPAVPPEADTATIIAMADRTMAMEVQRHPTAKYAVIQGEFTLVAALLPRLVAAGITPLAATTARDVVIEDDGTKRSVFRFVQFREYPV